MKSSLIAILALAMLGQTHAAKFRPLVRDGKVINGPPQQLPHIDTEDELGQQDTLSSLKEAEQQLHLKMDAPAKTNLAEQRALQKSFDLFSTKD